MKTTKQQLRRLVMTGIVIAGGATLPLSQAAESNPYPPATAATTPDTTRKAEPPKAEPKSEASKSVDSQVQAEVAKKAEEKRAQLLKDAQSAIEETQKAVEALDQNKKDEAMAALERVTGKLDLIIARDPKLALAPIRVSTIMSDLYSTPEFAKNAVKAAKSALDDGDVQQARALLAVLASEQEVRVTNIPLASYPAAIKAIVPLIDAGKTAEAKTALQTALNTLVIESYIIPLPKVRAEAMLSEAEKLAGKKDRSADENKRLHELVEDARHQLQLGEVLGYGARADYKPLYGQLDDIQKKTENGKSGEGFFEKIKDSLKNFKERIAS